MILRRVNALLVVVTAAFLAGCQEDAPQAATAPPPEVDVATPLKQNITEWEEFTGRFKAVRQVDVRARVSGYLVEKKFRDGQLVEKGDVLYVIDPRSFEFEVQRATATHAAAQKSYERASSLSRSQNISDAALDERREQMQVAEAALNVAKLNLEFTQIKAPTRGKISNDFVDIGNLVRENETILTRIVTVDPIHFEFEASQASLLKYMRLDRAGERPSSDRAPNPIVIKLLDEADYSHRGRMDFVDNIVDSGTGTIQGRALIENKDGLIYPGLFGRARLMGRSNFEAVLLPEKAINTDQDRKFVYVVNDEGKTQRQYIRPGLLLDNGLVIIDDGLKGHERIVVNGIQRIRSDEQEVTPVATKLAWQEIEGMPDPTSIPSLESIKGGDETTTTAAPSPNEGSGQ